MDKAVCIVMIAPVRKEKTEQSEMVSQILYGETVDIIENEKFWTKIKMDYDGVEGYVDRRQLAPLSDVEFSERKIAVLQEHFQNATTKYGKTLLSIGSEVDFPINEESLTTNIQEKITHTANGFLNIPFIWGGRSFFGVDSAGLVQLIFKVQGIKLPRKPHEQAALGEPLSFVEESMTGDLAFFENEDGEIVHVGLMLEDQKIIHASGKVRIDDLDSTGIFNQELNEHTHKLRFVKRVLSI